MAKTIKHAVGASLSPAGELGAWREATGRTRSGDPVPLTCAVEIGALRMSIYIKADGKLPTMPKGLLDGTGKPRKRPVGTFANRAKCPRWQAREYNAAMGR